MRLFETIKETVTVGQAAEVLWHENWKKQHDLLPIS